MQHHYHAVYHGVAFHTKWSLQHDSSCYPIPLQLAYTQSYMYSYGLTCTHTALYIPTQSYIYTHSLTCTHTVLHVQTQLYMYTQDLTCTHTSFHVHTQPYIYTHSLTYTHTTLYIHTSPTCKYTFMVDRR